MIVICLAAVGTILLRFSYINTKKWLNLFGKDSDQEKQMREQGDSVTLSASTNASSEEENDDCTCSEFTLPKESSTGSERTQVSEYDPGHPYRTRHQSLLRKKHNKAAVEEPFEKLA